MWRNEGVYGFFKGNGVNIVRIAPFSAFEFFFYDFYKNLLFSEGTSNVQKMICGGLTGMTASTLTYPLDVIRTVLSIKVQDSSVKPSIIRCGLEIYKDHGHRGLFKGLNATLISITPFIGFKMAFFDILKVACNVDNSQTNAQIKNFLLGGLSGTLAITITYPTDLIRRKL